MTSYADAPASKYLKRITDMERSLDRRLDSALGPASITGEARITRPPELGL